MTVLTLLSDFGLGDSYVSQMKGIILQGTLNIQIVDISHNIPRHNIIDGAFVLEAAVPYFPSGTVHVAVVDPGVGSRRLPIVIECKTATLVGPDNGLLERAASRLGLVAAYRIGLGHGAQSVSPTFHGRDIFARTAALLASGRKPNSIGPRLSKVVRLDLPEPKISKKNLRCIALHIDAFGNIITNVPNRDLISSLVLGKTLRVESGTGRWPARFVRTYHDARLGEMVALKGSQGYLELAAREQTASELMGVKALDKLKVSLMK